MTVRRKLPRLLLGAPLACLGVLGGLAIEGNVSYAHGGHGKPKLSVRYIRAFTNDDGVVDYSGKDAHDDGIDPGYDKDVAACWAEVVSKDTVQVTISNGYPSYTCTIWTRLQNTGMESLKYRSPTLLAPSQLTVSSRFHSHCYLLRPDHKVYQRTTVHVEQAADQNVSYQFTIEALFQEARHNCK